MDSNSYQNGRQQILVQLEKLQKIYDELKYKDTVFFNELPQETINKLTLLNREITRLKNPNLTVAFVGGFSAGKSSLINAFLGHYLLPESSAPTTAVPTYVSCGSNVEQAQLHYLGKNEVDGLGELYRKEIADTLSLPNLRNAASQEIIEKGQTLSTEGRGKKLIDHFECFTKEIKNREFSERGYIKDCTIPEMQRIVCDESESMFLDYVEVKLKRTDFPNDIRLVDLPGVSVPNPRHRQVTFRFVTLDANAVIFVMQATRIFDRDEHEIVEKIRTGESMIAERIFWVLNRWDSLNEQQQKSTFKDFKSKMEEFNIPNKYIYFTTNALHGLISQLAKRGETTSNDQLQNHFNDYEKKLNTNYGGDHDKAFQESQIPKLQQEVLDFLNNRLRSTTLNTAVTNTENNFCQPLLHYLNKAKEKNDILISSELKQNEREKARIRTESHLAMRRKELGDVFRSIRDKIAIERSTMFQDTKELEDTLRKEIKSGPETDSYEVYQRIIADKPLRKFPYYFEIEMKIVDNLNSMLKNRFLEISERQVREIVNELITNIKNCLDNLAGDVSYDSSVCVGFEAQINGIDQTFSKNVSGVVKDKVSQLDELMLYESVDGLNKIIGHFYGNKNKILIGLEKAAKMQSKKISNTFERISKEDMDTKTSQIRLTLENHYIDHIVEFRQQLAESVWPILIENILNLEQHINNIINTNYLFVLEQQKNREAQEEFSGETTRIQSQAKRFRETIDCIRDTSSEINKCLKSCHLPVQ